MKIHFSLLLMAMSLDKARCKILPGSYNYASCKNDCATYLKGVKMPPMGTDWCIAFNQVSKGVETGENGTNPGQPVDPSCLELFHETGLVNSYFSNGKSYATITQRMMDWCPGLGPWIKASGWRKDIWIAGSGDNEDLYRSSHFDGTVDNITGANFDRKLNSLSTEQLEDAKTIKLKSVTAWQRPIMCGDATLITERKALNVWAYIPTLWGYSFTKAMKYGVRNMITHWFLVCEFDDDLFVRIERTETGIFVTRCDKKDANEGHSWDPTCGNNHAGRSYRISNTNGDDGEYTNDTLAAQDVTLDSILNFCHGQVTYKYSMFFNNSKQFAKMAFDKFTTGTLTIPTIEESNDERNCYDQFN